MPELKKMKYQVRLLSRSIHLPLVFKIGFSFLILSFFFFFIKSFHANAASITTAVTVGNSAPVFTSGPAENPASYATTPTNVGSSTTFQATATDANNDNFYLIVCSTNSVNPTNGGAPTCGATSRCVSSSTASGSPASCSRTALAGDPVSNDWYAFVCDGTASAACSAASQGTGDSGSPFEVNHRPSFSNANSNTPQNPGGTLTWTATSTDPEDNVKLLVCKTPGISGNACDGGAGDTWCSSSFSASDPSCGYSIPAVAPDGSNSSYLYIIDEHNLESTGMYQASQVMFSISNTAPVVSAVTINGGSAINLTENTTTSLTLTATVTDNNSCYGSELSSIYAYAYRSGITYSGCDTAGEANTNFCYPEITCTVVGGSCTGNTDATADYTCTTNLQYYADPTDTGTLYPTETWKSSFKATDNNSATGTTEVSTGVELNSLTAFSVTSAINFGNLGIGQSNDPLDKIITTTPTGNVGLDQEVSGATNMCTNYPTCTGGTPIGVAYQKYSLTTATAYASGTALSASPVETELNVPKVVNGTPTTKNTWWGILIPNGTALGTYSGANTITGVKGETSGW